MDQGREGNFCDRAITRGERGQGVVGAPKKLKKAPRARERARPGATDSAKLRLKPICHRFFTNTKNLLI